MINKNYYSDEYLIHYGVKGMQWKNHIYKKRQDNNIGNRAWGYIYDTASKYGYSKDDVNGAVNAAKTEANNLKIKAYAAGYTPKNIANNAANVAGTAANIAKAKVDTTVNYYLDNPKELMTKINGLKTSNSNVQMTKVKNVATNVLTNYYEAKKNPTMYAAKSIVNGVDTYNNAKAAAKKEKEKVVKKSTIGFIGLLKKIL